MTSEQLQSTISALQARADACLANGERQYACGVLEAIQALRRLLPEPAKAPESPVEAPESVAPPAEPQEAPAPQKRFRKPKGV
jgi:hypothetical protein